MEASAVYRPHAEASASARLVPCPAPAAWTGLRSHRFEIVSRGDFVPGVLYASEVARPEAPAARTADRARRTQLESIRHAGLRGGLGP